MAKKKKTVQVAAPKDQPSENRELTWLEERFVEHYIDNNGNGTQAAIAAGYSRNSAASIASENLRKPHILQAVEHERERLRTAINFTREKALRILIAMATTTSDEVQPALSSPSQREAYRGLGDKRFALTVQKTPDGYFASTLTVSERRAALNDLWEKLGLDKDASEGDRESFLERFAGLGKRLGRSGTEEGSQ